MKCAICGKPAEKEGLCSNCFSDKNVLFEMPQNLSIQVCKRCSAVFVGKRWTKINANEAMEKLILKKMMINPDYDKIQVKIDFVEGKNPISHIKVSGFIGKTKLEHAAQREIKQNYELCTMCSQVSANAYQAILQLRGPKEKVIEVERYCREEIKKRDNVRITKEVKLKEGKDIYINSNSFAVSLIKKLLEKYGGQTKINEKTYSINRATSKTMYRLNALFRVFPFDKNSVVKYDNDIIKIISVGRNIKGISLKTAKTVNFKYDEDMKFEELKPVNVQISSHRPRIMVLHPENYQAMHLENEETAKEQGKNDTIEIVLDEERAYAV